MAEQLRVLFEKFVDRRHCAAVRLLCHPLHNSGALPPVHELFNGPRVFVYVYRFSHVEHVSFTESSLTWSRVQILGEVCKLWSFVTPL
jgi:hypothetical protein